MARSHLSEDEIRQTVSAVEMHRNPDGTIRLLETARYLRMPPRTLSHRIDKLKLDRKKFTAPFLPSESRSLDELVRDRIEESRRSKNADDARNLIPIQINMDGPFGLLIFGDPHVDDGGTDFELLAAHRQIAIEHPFVVSGSIGDHQNGWIGRLGSLYGSQMTTAKEAWKLVEWLVSPLNWLFLIGGNHDCLDMQTEVLTRRGWLKFDDIRDDDEIMSLIPETGEWEWGPILTKVDRQHDGEFHIFKGTPVDIRVTPNHRILHRKYNNWKKTWSDFSFIEANKIPAKFLIPVSATKTCPDFQIDDDWLIVAGWLLTDGSICTDKNGHVRISFYQSKECPSLESALSQLQLEHTLLVRNREITSICGRELKSPPLPQREYRMSAESVQRILSVIPRKKELPVWAFDLSNRQFNILLDAIVSGDGSWDGGNPSDKKCAVVHGEPQFLDSLQICAIQHGWRAHISIAREKDYRLNLCKKTEWQAHRESSVTKEYGAERVWCLTVPRGNFMVRRNGKAYFTGNCWQGSGDPLDWIARQNNSIYEPHGIRMVLNHPCGAKTRIHCRHDFSGNSIYHALHGPKREVLMGFRDHLIVAGHKHIGGAEQLVTPDGLVSQLVRVSGYKHVDHYANQLGLKKMPMHSSALIIIDPREPDTSAARCWCAPTVERGILFLDALRAQYKPVVKRSRK